MAQPKKMAKPKQMTKPLIKTVSPRLAAWEGDKNFQRLRARAEKLAAAPPPQLAEFLAQAQAPPPPLPVAARKFADGKKLAWLGMGGASLGAQALAALRSKSARPIFTDGLDEAGLAALLAPPHAPRHFVAVSQSGETAETLAQLAYVLAALRRAKLSPRTHVLGVAGAGEHALRRIAKAADFPLLTHEGASGRFSMAGALGAWSAHWLGLDAAALRRGVSAGLARMKDAVLGASQLVHAMTQGLNLHLVLAFAPQFESLGHWHRQLWGESLGKDGKGSTPLLALAPRDMHSQWQLYLAGPDDKFATMLCAPAPESDKVGHAPSVLPAGPAWLAGLSYRALLHSQQQAAEQELCAADRPVRRWVVPPRLEAIGEWMGCMMLETCLSAALFGLDPFTQPAVDSGKKRVRQFWQENPQKT